jgi:hypothetical protein
VDSHLRAPEVGKRRCALSRAPVSTKTQVPCHAHRTVWFQFGPVWGTCLYDELRNLAHDRLQRSPSPQTGRYLRSQRPGRERTLQALTLAGVHVYCDVAIMGTTTWTLLIGRDPAVLRAAAGLVTLIR